MHLSFAHLCATRQPMRKTPPLRSGEPRKQLRVSKQPQLQDIHLNHGEEECSGPAETRV